MKKIIALALLAVAVGAAAGVRYAGNDEPEYIQSSALGIRLHSSGERKNIPVCGVSL